MPFPSPSVKIRPLDWLTDSVPQLALIAFPSLPNPDFDDDLGFPPLRFKELLKPGIFFLSVTPPQCAPGSFNLPVPPIMVRLVAFSDITLAHFGLVQIS